MIQKISNPRQSSTNTVVVINHTACCGDACVECEYLVSGVNLESSTYLIFTFKNSVGVNVELRVDYTTDTLVLRTALIDFLEGVGYYVQNPMTDIYISFVADSISIAFYGCAEFVSLYSDNAGTAGSETLCNFTPVCDFYFESNGNGVDPVPVSKNGVDGTVTQFTMADTAEDVIHLMEDFFTTSTVTVVKNTDAGYFEITVTGAPNDLLFIDGEQGIKSNCRKVYTA
jgi:hypothetical protein